jgi:septum formation topological specificity factor MinE
MPDHAHGATSPHLTSPSAIVEVDQPVFNPEIQVICRARVPAQMRQLLGMILPELRFDILQVDIKVLDQETLRIRIDVQRNNGIAVLEIQLAGINITISNLRRVVAPMCNTANSSVKGYISWSRMLKA